jgi:AcrR family transcriptional regulator
MHSAESRSPDRILNKALELFSTKGYDATSVREICEAAEITKPTLYHFYGSKEGVYHALVEGALQEYKRRLVRQVEPPGSPRERLKAIARDYFAFARERRELVRFLFALIHNPPSSAPVTDFPQFYKGVVGLVSDVVEQGIADGTLRPGPTDVRMLVFMGALGESLCGYLITEQPELTPALADRLVDTIVEGWTTNNP